MRPIVAKIYRVFKLGTEWCVNVPDTTAGVHGSKERSHIVEWACDAARRVDGEVHVRNIGGEVEIIYAYKNGVQSIAFQDRKPR